MGGPPQRTATPPPAADLPQTGKPSEGADQQKNQRAGPPGMAASGSGEAPTASQPGTEPEEPAPDAEHDAGLPTPSAHEAQHAGRADAAPLATPAHHSDASTPGEAPPLGPPETCPKSESREAIPDTPPRAADRETWPGGHNHNEDPLDAFMESCMTHLHADPALAALRVRLEPRRDHTEGTPLAVSCKAHLQRNYTALGTTEHATAADDRPATASGAADECPDERGGPGSGTRVEAGTNTASEPGGQPPGTAPSWEQGHLDNTRLEGDTRHPSDHAEQAAAQDLGLWIDGLTTEGQFALAIRIRWLRTSQSRYLEEGTRTMTDITFGHRTGHTPHATMDLPSQWHYVATRLMAHMGAYSPDEMNRQHWQGHQRAALHICTTIQRHNVWDIPGSPGYQGHASGHRRPRSQEVPEPPRQAARRNSPERHQGPAGGVDFPSGTYRSPLRPFAQRRGQGSPHAPGAQGGAPQRHQETRNPGRSRRRSHTPPPAAQRVVFHENTNRGHGGPKTSTPNGHHLPPIPHAGPRGPARNGRTVPPFPRQPSERDRQRFTRTPDGQQAEGPVHPPPPSQDRRPADYRGDSTPRTHGQRNRRTTKGLHKGWGDNPPNAPPRERDAMTPVPDTGSGHPTEWACTPRGSPPQLQHSHSIEARGPHRINGSTTRAARERTPK